MIKQTLKVASVILLGVSVAAMAQPKKPKTVVYKFFDEQYRQGGFDYAYGGKSKGITITKDGGYKSKAALQINLDPREYSGASICLYNEFFDLNKYMLDSKAALSAWITMFSRRRRGCARPACRTSSSNAPSCVQG